MEVERSLALPRVRELSFNLRPRRGCNARFPSIGVAVIRVAGSVLHRDGPAMHVGVGLGIYSASENRIHNNSLLWLHELARACSRSCTGAAPAISDARPQPDVYKLAFWSVRFPGVYAKWSVAVARFFLSPLESPYARAGSFNPSSWHHCRSQPHTLAQLYLSIYLYYVN